MKNTLLIVCISCIYLLSHSQNSLHSSLDSLLENPEIFEIGQEPPHASLRSFSMEEEAFYIPGPFREDFSNLNGKWKFHRAPVPEEAPSRFFEPGYDVSEWEEINVPSNWQMEGFGHPKFRNIAHPFKSDPPRVPDEYNPTGSYKRTFTIPETWKEKIILLRFEGVHSAFLLWINGKEAGYNQGGMEPAEFDITDLVRSGNNEISVQVYRYSDGTYLEDQDMWRLSGIFRDVYLLALPGLSIRDYYVTTDFDENYQDATLSVTLGLKNSGPDREGNYRTSLMLSDPSGDTVAFWSEEIKGTEMSGNLVSVQNKEILSPLHWVPEDPNLYKLRISLLKEDKVIQEIVFNVGFREIEYRNSALFINGREVKLNAVNSHMQHPELGHAMNRETMVQDLILMKQFNINCVRTSHYPPEPAYLYLADKYGMYIIDETGDEAHGTTWISGLPEWKEAYIDRMEKMLMRDRNHPSIIMWSAGNETGDGENICTLIAGGKKLDPTRPKWMYGGNTEDPALNRYHPCEDIIGPRYPLPFELEHYVGKASGPEHSRPSFMDEYMAATGNGLGGMDEYWEVIRNYPRIIGGAVWDWISPGITMAHLSIPDHSGNNVRVMAGNRPELVDGKIGKAIRLNGHDSRIEFYRHRELDLQGEEFTLDFYVKPGEWNGFPYLVSKGNHQFGVMLSANNTLTLYAEAETKVEVSAPLPHNRTGEWHHITGIYNGKELQLYLNGKKIASAPMEGKIKNRPFPVCLGWNAEITGMEHAGYTGNASFDHFRIFDKAIPVAQLIDTSTLQAQPLVFLKMDNLVTGENYYSLGLGARSYGLVWPDRRVQPELWQLKKSGQPLSFEFAHGTIGVSNPFGHLDFQNLSFQWELLREGSVVTWGKVDSSELSVEGNACAEFPFSIEQLGDNSEFVLRISARLRQETLWSPADFEVAWEEFFFQPYPGFRHNKDVKYSGTDLEFIESDSEIRISNSVFSLSMDNMTGGNIALSDFSDSLVLKGPAPHLWRAPTANDLDGWTVWRGRMSGRTEGMGNDVANGWRSLGLDNLTHIQGEWTLTGKSADKMVLEASVLSKGIDNRSVFTTDYTLGVSSDGSLELKTEIECHHRMPEWLPVVGIQFEIDTALNEIEWYGRGPFETYPDRKTGAKTGIWNRSPEELYEPYLIPQDYGNRTDVRWLSMKNKEGTGFKIDGQDLFNFSVQEYDTDNLTRAQYPFHLRKSGNLILNLDHAVNGVGGNAISVLRKYRVYPGKFTFRHRISFLKNN